MLDRLIAEQVEQISYNQIELSNIASTLSNLKSIIRNEPEYDAPFLGGSYKRATMVKGISDVDVYFKYIGNGNSQSSLTKLKNCLMASYPSTIIKQDKPSILVDFNKIPMNITPYKQDYSGNMSIPDRNLIYWQSINFGELERNIILLRQKNRIFIDLIKILKLWNRNCNKGLRNFDIEKRVCNLFLYNHVISYSISDLLWTFFNNNGFINDAQKIFTITKSPQIDMKVNWLKFIQNR